MSGIGPQAAGSPQVRPQAAASPQVRPQAVPAKGGPSPYNFSWNLGFSGVLWVLAGLLICGSFFLPWFRSSLVCNDAVCQTLVKQTPKFLSSYTSSVNGFSIASGTFTLDTSGPAGMIHDSFGFLWLWLVILAGVALVVLPLTLTQGKMHAGRTRIFLLIFCLFALAVEIIYWLSANQALQQTRTGLAALLALKSGGHEVVYTFSTGPTLGFWLALAATLVATGASATAHASASGRSFDTMLFMRNLGLGGQMILLAGLALCIAFFLPWFSTPDPTANATGGYEATATKGVFTVAKTMSVSAWSAASNGFPNPLPVGNSCSTSCPTFHITIFLSLWLIPVVGLGLIWIAWMMGRGLLWRRMAAIIACVMLLVALAQVGFFLLEVQSLQSFDQQLFLSQNLQLTGTVYGVTWGFWVALVASGVALLVSSFLLLQRHKSVTGKIVGP